MKLGDVKKIVKEVLTENVCARDDDYLLYELVCGKITNTMPFKTMFVETLFYNIRYGYLPTIEGVSRARRKLQAEHEDLRGSKTVSERRKKLEEEHYEFYGHTGR